jgi:dipeptidyl aminopeptidase/acylaminoacyl peptidase
MREFATRILRPSDLCALSYVHDARLSPDGHRFACVTSWMNEAAEEEHFTVTLEDLSTGRRVPLAFAGRATLPRWSPSGRQLAFVGTKENSSRIYLSDDNGVQATAITPEGWRVEGPPMWSPDGSKIACTVVRRQERGPIERITKRLFRAEGLGAVDELTQSIHVIDLERGSTRVLEVRMPIACEPMFSPCGTKLLFLGADVATGLPRLRQKLFVADLANGEIVEVLGGRWYIGFAAWSHEGERIVFAGAYDSPLTVPMSSLWVVNRDGSGASCRTEGFSGDLGLHVHHDMPTSAYARDRVFAVPQDGCAYATVTKEGCGEIWRIALDGPIRFAPIVSGARTCVIMDASSKTDQLLYAACDLSAPWDLHLSDLSGNQPRRLTQLNDSVLASWPRLQVEPLRIRSADGLALDGWHLRRAERKGAQPTILFIHGGPDLASGHYFRFDFQLLAANGYAVVFANFRGSSGYGSAFMRGLQGDWGARGYADHIATIDAAIEAGLADRDRIGLWGPSHGGFATCWIIGHTTRFRAAVAESAVTHFTSLYYLTDLPDVFAYDLGGRPDEIPDVYRSRSPLTYAGRCRTPTLILHGADDLRCPIAEGEQFYRALHDAGCPTELVRIAGMDHMGGSIGPLPIRIARDEALLDWFERYL